eukprot:CAMPEP_0181315450 /NCGR_PEP_ID=MMETSP1101-20121128/15385_1 /TAXON_ID=46948 /ORGANISM="Rhodomonas abbreviata, Strain Caron Lab Isolate" /LENGTH=527 /DNA_ID=CAMNT_0023422665 /DNA_START=179 /DNA_END=1758 /DNA_ORIENTATION=+
MPPKASPVSPRRAPVSPSTRSTPSKGKDPVSESGPEKKEKLGGQPTVSQSKQVMGSMMKLRKLVSKIGYTAIKSKDKETIAATRKRWADWRLSLRKCTRLEDFVKSLLLIEDFISKDCKPMEWKESRREWRSAVQSCSSGVEGIPLVRSLEQSGIIWEKLAIVDQLIDATDMIPSTEFSITSDKFWVDIFPAKLRDSPDPGSYAAVLMEVEGAINRPSEVLDPDWGPMRAKWLRDCKACKTWERASELFKQWETDAIDWEVAGRIMVANKKGEAIKAPGKAGKPKGSDNQNNEEVGEKWVANKQAGNTSRAMARHSKRKVSNVSRMIDGAREQEASLLLLQLGTSLGHQQETQVGSGKKGGKKTGRAGAGGRPGRRSSKEAGGDSGGVLSAGEEGGGQDTESEDEKEKGASKSAPAARSVEADPNLSNGPEESAHASRADPVMVVAQPADRTLRTGAVAYAQAFPIVDQAVLHTALEADGSSPPAAACSTTEQEADKEMGTPKRGRGKRKGAAAGPEWGQKRMAHAA